MKVNKYIVKVEWLRSDLCEGKTLNVLDDEVMVMSLELLDFQSSLK